MRFFDIIFNIGNVFTNLAKTSNRQYKGPIMKISDMLLRFVFGYLPNIAAILLVAYFFRLMFYYNINPYTYWFFTFCIAISSSISIYKYRNRPLKKLRDYEIDQKISIKNWMYLLFFAGISVGGAYMIHTINQ